MSPDSKSKDGGGKDGGSATAALEKARERIREQLSQSESQKQVNQRKRRIGIAQEGMKAYQEKDLGAAAQSFKTYLKVLEDSKGAPEGGLSPSQFDKKAELAEMMLLSAVYWELAKLFDRTRSPEKYAEFKRYLSKYILFSQGMVFQKMCSDTIRKYIRARRPVHKNDFKDAYKLLGGTQCFVATELDEHCLEATLPRLRAFRDGTLQRSRAGQFFVAWYYRNGPGLARVARVLPPFGRHAVGRALDGFAALTSLLGISRTR